VSGWSRAEAPAKLNLALVVGPRREDGMHEVATVLTRLALADTIRIRRTTSTRVEGFEGDTLVRSALDALAAEAEAGPGFEVRIEKRIPVAAGLGGGSSDAATALRLANALLDEPLPRDRLERLAAGLGADVPFFLHDGPRLGTADGRTLEPVALPTGYTVLLLLPSGAVKHSTGAVYAAFDERGGEGGFGERTRALRGALDRVRTARDLAALPPNDLATAAVAVELEALGAFRADVTGAGPAVYGLFATPEGAARAAAAIGERGETWITTPA
jgi:4-diphosphocytidyl-2-C-methyl-D-erythritol kinase